MRPPEHGQTGGTPLCALGQSLIHGFSNGGDVDARFLAVISLGLLGSGYLRDVAEVLAGAGPPDVGMIGEVMRRHGLTPVSPA
jgi:hypothetical protein